MNIDPNIIKLLKDAGCRQNVINHCIAVCNLSLVFAKNAPVDIKLVKTGALLHDIGRSKTHSLAHGQIGADICRDLGIPENVCLIVERHIGAGLTAEECAKEGLKSIDCIPKSLEEKIVAHSDNLIKGTEEISLKIRLELSKDLPGEIKERIVKLAEEIEIYR
ncbi:HDIG domain-containing protein [Methanoplanus sp. FWC-SCC4]|uniref:HDIG domain-containing protein n=1 Tax=Methanochimaera problematica TaxID=2609417 RepID=A0AA97FB65_9EURY|nr:HDIG domain-containing metalloprotein [Methanoplanus sp. FWC-SCC4]WOF15877.1 HDIG domain-containing protein [Methanoplanus sp. FWC-SCC4]